MTRSRSDWKGDWRDQRGMASILSLSIRQTAYLVKAGMPTEVRDGKRCYYAPACCQWYILRTVRDRWRRKGYSDSAIQSMIDADPQLRAYQRWESRNSCSPAAIRAYEDEWNALERADSSSPGRCAHCGAEA
jgi:hypothetical protein